MTQQLITTDEATVRSMTVEVKVMKIGNKQVTLAVFRQLPEEQIIDYATGKLKGQPWGRVNHHPDCSKEMMPHFHVVWQKGDTLYRTAIEKRWQYVRTNLPEEIAYDGPNPLTVMLYVAEAYLFARILEGWYFEQSAKDKYIRIKIEDGIFPFPLEDTSTPFDNALKSARDYRVSKSLYENLKQRCLANADDQFAYNYVESAKETFVKAELDWHNTHQEIGSHLKSEGFPVESNALYQSHLIPAFQALNQYRQNWQQSYAQLEQLDQLFIAV